MKNSQLSSSVGGELIVDKLQLSSPSLQSHPWNLLKSSRHETSRTRGIEVEKGPWERDRLFAREK